MHTGKGTLILRDGRRLLLNYQFATDYDLVRSGYLYLDTSGIDLASYGNRMGLICEDGTAVEFVVIHFGARYLAIAGHTVSLAA